MLLDLHAYSDLSGDNAIHDAIAEAKRRGIDGVCIVDREHSATTAVALADGEYDFPIFVGVEVSTRAGEAIIFTPDVDPYLTREEWRELNALQRPELAEVTAWANERGGVVVLSHPYERSSTAAPRDRIFAISGISGVEIGTDVSDPTSDRVAVEAVARSTSPACGGSAHDGDQNGSKWLTLFAEKFTTQEELVAAIRAGDFWAVEVSNKPFEQRRRQPRPERSERPRRDGARDGARGGRKDAGRRPRR
ncbi:MAG: putative metal-dependent phosphoesterase TrpH [Bradymonadia bacterium]|jgi:predicted metal-dependent phosphoesterase TrpH